MALTKDAIVQHIAAIVTTLNETDGAPESMLYLFLQTNMADYELIRDILVNSGSVTISGNYVRLTEHGREMARKIEAMIAQKSL